MLPEETARRMADQVLAQGRLVLVPGAGHAVPVDNAPGLLRELERFLAASR
jgi:pimeloyl-ACP methyl ester carboxylesterase